MESNPRGRRGRGDRGGREGLPGRSRGEQGESLPPLATAGQRGGRGGGRTDREKLGGSGTSRQQPSSSPPPSQTSQGPVSAAPSAAVVPSQTPSSLGLSLPFTLSALQPSVSAQPPLPLAASPVSDPKDSAQAAAAAAPIAELAKKREEQLKEIEELKKAREERKTLREQNAKLHRPDEAFFKKLDSSIKKIPPFIKKLNAMLKPENEAAILQELVKLNLSRYVSEVVNAIGTAPLRLTDVPTAVKVISALHGWYADFLPELLRVLYKVFAPDKQEPLTRKRPTLRLLAELLTHGAAIDPRPLLKIVSLQLEDYEKNASDALSLLLSFVRYARGSLFAAPKSAAPESKGGELELEDDLVVEPPIAAKFADLMARFWAKAADHLLAAHKELQATERSNRKVEENKGELPADVLESYQKQRQEYDKTVQSVTTLAELMHRDLPELPQEEKKTRMVAAANVDDMFKADEAKESVMWSDEGIRAFYEDLPDLRLRVLPAALGLQEAEAKSESEVKKAAEGKKEAEGKKAAEGAKESEATKEGASQEAAKPQKAEEKKHVEAGEKKAEDKPVVEAKAGEAEKEEEEDKEGTTNERLARFLASLESMLSRERVDQFAEQFCDMASKGNRKKLVNHLFAVKRDRLDLLPYYARLTAVLHQYFKDVASALVAKLEKEFEQLQSQKDQLKIESKIKNIRFLAELVKFRVCAPEVMFTCLKACLSDFVFHNIDICCTALESCGRFLYVNPDTSVMANSLLERMLRLKKSKALDPKTETMIDNAYYVCKPPDRVATLTKGRPPRELYLRRLVYSELSERNAKAVMRKLRKFDWTPGGADELLLLKIMLHGAYKGRYSAVPTLASIVSGIARYHERWGVLLVDLLLEEMRRCLSKANYIFHQRLMSYVRFLGELYNYSLIEHPLIFDTLYFLIGMRDGRVPDAPDAGDPPTDLFRIRLVCMLLMTVGSYFQKGATRQRLDLFLVHFQRYVLSKVFFSRDIAFLLDDTFALLNVAAKRYETFEEAAKAAEDAGHNKALWLPKSMKVTPEATGGAQAEEEVGEARRTAERDEGEAAAAAITADEEGGDEEEGGDDDGEEGEEDEDDEDEEDEDEDEEEEEEEEDMDEGLGRVIKPKAAEYVASAEDDAFSKEFEHMVSQDRVERKADALLSLHRGVAPQIAIPLSLMRRDAEQVDSDLGQAINFKVLMKKGNKQKALDLAVPQDAKLSVALLKGREEASESNEEMKRRVIQLEHMAAKQEADEEARRAAQAVQMGVAPYAPKAEQRAPKPQPRPAGFYQGPGFDDWDKDEVGTSTRDLRAQLQAQQKDGQRGGRGGGQGRGKR